MCNNLGRIGKLLCNKIFHPEINQSTPWPTLFKCFQFNAKFATGYHQRYSNDCMTLIIDNNDIILIYLYRNAIRITETSYWARWRLKSPASRLFTQPLILSQITENIKALRHWPLCWEFFGDRGLPAQRASNAENVSIWWRHHVGCKSQILTRLLSLLQ